MPGGTLPVLGNIPMSQAIYVTLTPAASVAGASSSTSTYTINGLVIGDLIDLYPQSALTATLSMGAIYVASANTLSLQWINASASTSTSSPTAINFVILVNRTANSYAGVSSLASSIT